VLYAGQDLATSACEVFGEAGEAQLCPAWRVALLRPARPLSLLDLTAPGSAMAIGALPSLAGGAYPRQLTQAWARAVYEDDPTGSHVDGVRYRSAYNGGLALALWTAHLPSTSRAPPPGPGPGLGTPGHAGPASHGNGTTAPRHHVGRVSRLRPVPRRLDACQRVGGPGH